ncbi:spore germination protein KA [Paenibacillus sp. J31TS4]|uniref:spore germination protein n=1 Tax=Paenibacillus sp. J31TS4 TaxID=2807195 RepID=UPI001B06A4BA|nr:spore germination protein [Paenibacillus sp. J31TS4]GIP39428.1 spore germination protein KA [Paenibacillus sp. J31TS4]
MPAQPNPDSIHSQLDDSLSHMKQAFGFSTDLICRELILGRKPGCRMALLYIDGLAQVSDLLQSLLSLLTNTGFAEGAAKEDALQTVKRTLIPEGDVRELERYEETTDALTNGSAVLLLDGSAAALSIGVAQTEKRGVEEPSTQSVIRGPREGFTETLRVNTALVRRKVRNSRLRLESGRAGQVTRTDLAIMYIEGIADPAVVQEVRDRLNDIRIDGILESGYVEEMIQDSTRSPFPTVYNTERPDSVAAALLEGRVAIFVDGTPFVLLVPALFMQFFQAPEDYYQRADFATLLRLLRFLSFFIALLAPSLYIAVTTFHQELIPTSLLISLAGQREGVPFPAFVEALLMEITFEILREAGVRMPKTIGQSVSIVGTLVIGEAAVNAGLVSPAMVIIVSITAISNFVMPAFSMGISIRMIRLVMMGLAASFGLLGIIVGLLALLLHLCSLRSFGTSYMTPFAPLLMSNIKDTLLRIPWSGMLTRPKPAAGKGRNGGQPNRKKGGSSS